MLRPSSAVLRMCSPIWRFSSQVELFLNPVASQFKDPFRQIKELGARAEPLLPPGLKTGLCTIGPPTLKTALGRQRQAPVRLSSPDRRPCHDRNQLIERRSALRCAIVYLRQHRVLWTASLAKRPKYSKSAHRMSMRFQIMFIAWTPHAPPEPESQLGTTFARCLPSPIRPMGKHYVNTQE